MWFLTIQNRTGKIGLYWVANKSDWIQVWKTNWSSPSIILNGSWTTARVGLKWPLDVQETKSVVTKLAILCFLFDHYKVDCQWILLPCNRSSTIFFPFTEFNFEPSSRHVQRQWCQFKTARIPFVTSFSMPFYICSYCYSSGFVTSAWCSWKVGAWANITEYYLFDLRTLLNRPG